MCKKLLNLCMVALLSVVSTAAWALSQVDGVYQIGTAEDLEEFTALVNKGNRFANALLTADIVKSSPSTMIGTDAIEYEGIFDGAGHSITIDLKTESRGIALFRWVGRKGIVKDLKVQGEITTSSDWAAAIAVETRGIVRGCYVDVKINSTRNGDATDGAIAFRTSTGTIVEDCLAKLNIQGASTQNCGGVVGWANGKTSIVNCLAINSDSNFDISNGASNGLARNPGNVRFVNVESYNADNYANRPDGGSYNNYVTDLWGAAAHGTVTQVNVEDLADGRICYQLNNDQSRIAWVQNIGTDPFPVPAAFGTGQVYASVPTDCAGKAEGDVTYSNNGTDQATKHTLDAMGICTTCGYFDFHAFDYCYEFGSDRYVKLANTTDIDRCEVWNKAIGGFKLNMKMVDDIEYKAEPGRFIFNTTDWVDGDFNGQGHTLTIEMTNVGEHAAFIPEMTGNFENVIMHGKITTSGTRAGSISANGRMALIRNVYSDVNITSTRVGDNTSGGFCGWMGDKEKRVENCIYAGTFTLPGAEGGARCARVGGFTGWTATKTYFTNCAVLGKIIGAGNQTLDNDTENSQNIGRNPGNVVTENVYVLNPIEGNSVSDHDKYIAYGETTETTEINENGETVTVKHYTPNTEGVANGELTFLLNGKQSGFDRFYQLIGTDPNPIPIEKEGALVYADASEGYVCDGTPLGTVSYSNTPSTPVIPDHTNVDGFCTVCGTLQEDYMTPVDGWYEISNGTQLAWWSNYATKYPTVKGRLTADINMSGKMTKFTPIGSQASLFVGEFDGQGHVIKNFVLTSTSDYQGLFGVIGDGAVIKNFVLDNTCSITGGWYCGIIGGTNGGGNVYLTNLGNEGPVTGGRNTSGIIGTDMGGSATLFITNCYVMGAVKGTEQSAVICSWSNASSVLKNCWSIASLEGKYGDEDSFTRGSAACVNCYEIEGVGTQNNKTGANRTNLFTEAELANGALCAKLNTIAFRQNVSEDAHPVFDQTHAVMKEITDAGYATMYIPVEVNIPTGVNVFTGEFEETWLKLNPVESTVPASEPVVLKGNKGYYGFQPAAAATENVAVNFPSMGFTNAQDVTTVTAESVTFTFGQGTNTEDLAPKYYNSGTAIRMYKGNTMSISAGGATITKIVFSLTGTPTFNTGTYNATSTTWEGEATTVTLSNEMSSGQIRVKSATVYYSVASGGVANIEGNVLKGTDEEIDAVGKYILAQPEGEPVGFYLANTGKIAAGKAYLEVPEGTDVKAFFLTGDDATGIANVEKTVENGAIYNLAGQRISKMQKGINIINGKKVLK